MGEDYVTEAEDAIDDDTKSKDNDDDFNDSYNG